MNDEMGKRNTTRAIKQQTNQNKLIEMKEFLQSQLEEEQIRRKKRKCWFWYTNIQANKEIRVRAMFRKIESFD